MNPKTFEELQNDFKSFHNPEYYLGIDIGGTNTRIILSIEQSTYEVSTFKASKVVDLIEGVKSADTKLYPLLQNPPLATCCCMAGPTSNVDRYRFTNYDQSDAVLDPVQLPQRLCPSGKTFFLNDLESGCYGLISLIKHNLVGFYTKQFTSIVIPTRPSTSEIFVVMAPGTGLGVGLINHKKGQYYVSPSEFGHIQISPHGPNHPNYKEEQALLNNIIPNEDPTRQFSLEYEDIVSGRGLVACYKYYSGGDTKLGHDIAHEANASSDPENASVKAMKAHYAYLFKGAQELAVGLKATGVYLIGDNIVHNSRFFDANRPFLLDQFYCHPKKAWIENTPINIQTVQTNLNLLGTVYYARHHGQL
ncbi:hypothetical protein DFA_01476 [Cavenderia fasciculata]|uniref:Glucokinase n=1 Tax=Cavenderia fasciculata TaxID=261658 RepID=F4PT14_CACFS|nr:uncharacterized protein DFA_01476 [Cavenderia fasciculata]EGG21590.1 hypothetical protein DFA_01476 [Cavenderia fasciculata]|eukprot:XP_004359440.1 hypothetical protein DFA_01476 [Cavenderia fasciculata]